MRFAQPNITYLAAPLSSDDPNVVAHRRRVATQATVTLMDQGITVFSPVTYGMPVRAIDHVISQEEWYRFDLNFLRICTSLTVLTLPGWEQSKGVSLEIKEAQKLGIPVNHMSPDDLPSSPDPEALPSRLREWAHCLSAWALRTYREREREHLRGNPRD